MNTENHPILEDATDEVLCAMAAAGNQAAEEALVTRYHRFVRACARPLFLTGGDSEDLIQEGMVGLLHAVREYDPAKAASFSTFAQTCIRNRLYSALRSAGCDKHSPLNRALSLDAPFFDTGSYASGSSGISHHNPEEQIISQDYVDRLLKEAMQQCSSLEAQILDDYLGGLTCREIALALNRPYKSVDNAIQRVRRKIARQISSCDISKG